MHTKRQLLELLRAHGFRLKKRLGQHYLIDPRLAKRLVSNCQITTDDTVIEIGAGLGALTCLLAARAKEVLAIEVDRGICELLKARTIDFANVQVRCQDILTFDWAGYPCAKVVGTIPYHITSPILVALCEQKAEVADVWLGLQHEVAQRLCAPPATKAYGRLSLMVGYRFEVTPLLRIPRSAFFPQPRVDSVWVRLAARDPQVGLVEDERLLFDVIRAAFSHRRKTLKNCLGELAHPRLDSRRICEAIEQARLPERIRGEELSLEVFVRLSNAIKRGFSH